jgi:hypothetical protein
VTSIEVLKVAALPGDFLEMLAVALDDEVGDGCFVDSGPVHGVNDQ